MRGRLRFGALGAVVFELRGLPMRRCLVADDASVIRKVARHIIEGQRYEVSEAENGQQALQLCREQIPDVILLDWHMPSMSPFEFLAAFRNLPDAKRTTVIYCTTEHDPVDISRALAAGADDYLLKPFDRASLEGKLADIAAPV